MLRKAKRFKQWTANPVSQGKDLDYWHFKCQDAKQQLHEIEVQTEEWNIQFEQSRKLCLQVHQDITAGNRRLKRQSKHLFRLCENECAQNGSTSKTFTNKDLVEELVRRDQLFEKLQNEVKEIMEEQAVEITLSEEDCVATDDCSPAAATTGTDGSGIKVKAEQPSEAMDVVNDQQDGGDDGSISSNVTDTRQLGKQLITTLQQLNDFITRSESMENDIEWFFMEQDDLTMVESLIYKELVESNHNNNKSASSSTATKNLGSTSSNGNHDMLTPPPPPLNGTMTEEKEMVNRSFVEKILNSGNENDKDTKHAALRSLLNKVYEAMDPSGTTTRKKKQRVNADQTLTMRTFPRHRTEIQVPLLLSAASCFEDRYMGVSKSETIFSPAIATVANDNVHGNVEKVYQISNPTPLPLQRLEDEVMERCRLQSEAAYTAEKIKKLQSQLFDLQRSLQEATNAHHRALQVYRLVENEDINERQRMKNNHIQYGLVPATAAGDNSSSTTASGESGNTTTSTASSTSTPVPGTGAAVATETPVIAKEDSTAEPAKSATPAPETVEEPTVSTTTSARSSGKGGKGRGQSRR